MRKNLIINLSLALLLVLTFTVSTMAAEYTINAGIGLNDKSAQYKSLEFFKELVEKNSDGQIEVNLYHSSQLGDDREMMEALQMGVQEMTCPSTAPIAPFVNGFKVFDLPFLFPTHEAADYVLDGPVGQDLLKQLEDVGIVGLAFWENGYRQLTNSVRPVETPEDVKGLKIRTMENPMHLAAWKEMGANPTPMAFGELFSAMQQGVVDGQENPWGTIYLQNFFEVQDYTTNTGHVYSPFVLMISKQFYDKLPSDLQDVVYEAAQKAKDHNRRTNRAMNAEYLEKLKDVMNVTILTPEQKAAFQEAVQPVYDQFKDEIGADLVEEVQAQVKEFQAQQ
ncbi:MULTISPECIES: TRAP transporter substrate-binding protein [Halanaerobium]|uniref:Tripartite ATP-independent transporter solute receptor, DctP family n=1 Tax=Halanaerobium kushneri TaxID=56779 RepID=A0A1N6RIQ0_9FIRM|nr:MULTISPECIES: TRAP transporter substrate-binding protein [Halanaerobium]RCW58630.1 tripartite ATP-independent transporter DctP family solute receptor [Halanaerobium sp. ST460_2HS_T2]SIQ28711.1 tripartite ATP-independent transporter solute receptor, DctP family [Halanaerobium kushneri]